MVLHEKAQRIKKKAVVSGYLSDQWPVKVPVIVCGGAQTVGGLEAMLPLFQGVLTDRVPG